MCSLPKGWEVKKLGEVCEVFTDGDWIESKDQSIEGVRLIQTGNIGFGVYKDRKDKARFISEETFSRLKCTEVLPNDLLISRLPDPVGKSCIVPNIISKMITGVDCTIVRTVDNLVPKFLLYYQMSNQYLMDVELRITGATRSRISRKNLGLTCIPLPPLPEQKRIVAILEKAFTAIDQAKANTEKNLKNARELFQSKLQETFANGKLKIDNGEWEYGILDDVVKKGSSNISLNKIKDNDGEYSVFGAKGLVKNVSFFQQEQEYLAIIKDGAGIGRVSRHPKKSSVLATMQYLILKEGFDIGFVEYFLNSINFEKHRTGSTIPHIYFKNYKLEQFPIPPLPEQKQIVKKLDSVSTETKKLEAIYQRKITCLDELKKSILQKAFNGEL